MPAIVRQTMSRTLARDLLSNIQNSSDEYYIGIGKCDTFNQADSVIDPVDCLREEREFRNNLQSIKKVEGSTMVARRVNWSSGSTYAGWDDSVKSDIDENWTPFYVLNDAKEVYVCISPADAVSTVEPNWGLHAPMSPETDPNAPMYNVREWWKPFITSDGYVWKFLYTLTPERIFQFLSSNHIPVQKAEIDLPSGDSIEDLQITVRDTAIPGEIIRTRLVTAGTGYSQSSPPTVNIHGDGNGATAVAVIDENGNLVKVEMSNYGSGYTYASFEIIGGSTPSVVEPVITSKKGLGFDPVDDLKTSSVMINTKPDGTVNDTFIVDNTFRQMGLIKNPLSLDLDAEGDPIPYINTSDKVLPSITLVGTSTFTKGTLITGTTSGAKAYVDDSIGNEIYYHQNLSTGFEPFLIGENGNSGEGISNEGASEYGVVVSVTLENAIDRFSGEVLYIENRSRIRRHEEQKEDIKIVITV
jgi:hypothetical protein